MLGTSLAWSPTLSHPGLHSGWPQSGPQAEAWESRSRSPGLVTWTLAAAWPASVKLSHESRPRTPSQARRRSLRLAAVSPGQARAEVTVTTEFNDDDSLSRRGLRRRRLRVELSLIDLARSRTGSLATEFAACGAAPPGRGGRPGAAPSPVVGRPGPGY
jgi:hypothetical protein